MLVLFLFGAGFVSWAISTLSAGGGSVLFVALLNVVVSSRAVAPLVTIVSMVAAPVRLAVFWQSVDWRVVRWYTPGGVCGAALGSWLLTRVSAGGLDLLVALFFLSSAWQYRLGELPRSFPMPLPGFLPLSFAVGLLSAMIGASGLVATPFYLNYGLLKEALLATRAANSLAIQITKIGAYLLLDVFNTGLLANGLIAGAGAGTAILLSRPLLDRIDGQRFRTLAVLMMMLTGLYILWRRRALLLALLG